LVGDLLAQRGVPKLRDLLEDPNDLAAQEAEFWRPYAMIASALWMGPTHGANLHDNARSLAEFYRSQGAGVARPVNLSAARRAATAAQGLPVGAVTELRGAGSAARRPCVAR
jgi:hypothetical protein